MSDESSAAPSAAPLSPTDALASASPEALATWRDTGELPAEDPSPAADSTPADVPAHVAADAVQDALPAASSTAKPRADNADTRKQQLAAEIQDLLRQRALLRRDLEAPPARPDARPAGPSPAPGATDPEPDPEDTSRYPDGLYDRRFMKDQANWEAREVLRSERAAAIERHQQAEAQDRAFKRLEAFYERVNEAKAKYPDFEQKLSTVQIREGSPIDVWVMDSDLGAELLYGPLSNVAEVRRIAALPALQQVRELVKLEASLQPAAAKQISDAPAPPRTLGDRTTTSGDPVDRAVRAHDVAAFLAAENERDMARMRGPSHR